MNVRRALTTLAAVGVLTVFAVVPGRAQTSLDLNLLKSIDLTASFAGGLNPSAVAWNGTDAYIASFTSAAGSTGIIRVADARNTATVGPVFGSLTTAASRGFSGLAISGNFLAAAWDNGANDVNSFRGFNITDPTNPTQAWDLSVANVAGRGSGGAAVDPGFNGNGGGFAGLFLGSGFERTFNTATGASVSNMNVNTNPISTTWRDLAFNPANGDFFARENNRLIKGTRTASNAVVSPTTAIGNLSAGVNINNQNLAFINGAGGNALILNDRTAVGGSQVLSNVVKGFDTNGNAVTINYTNGFNAAATGNGAYDFYYDSGTQTLAMTDFSNRQLYIFGVGGSAVTATPEAGTGALFTVGLGGVAGVLVVRRRVKARRAN